MNEANETRLAYRCEGMADSWSERGPNGNGTILFDVTAPYLPLLMPFLSQIGAPLKIANNLSKETTDHVDTINTLIDNKADIHLGRMSLLHERYQVVDYFHKYLVSESCDLCFSLSKVA